MKHITTKSTSYTNYIMSFKFENNNNNKFSVLINIIFLQLKWFKAMVSSNCLSSLNLFGFTVKDSVANFSN